jgi:DNA-binding protein YbaB
MFNYPVHPDVERALEDGRRMLDQHQRVAEMFHQVLATKDSEDGLISVSVTGGGKVADLFLGDGAIDKYRGQELEHAILALVNEATEEAFGVHSTAANAVYATRASQ